MDDECILSCLQVIVIVSIVIDDEQTVYHHSAEERCHQNFARNTLQPLWHSPGNKCSTQHDAKECKYQDITQSLVAERGGIEEAEDDAADAHDDHLPSTKQNQWQSDDAAQEGSEENAFLHGTQRNPALSASSLGSKSSLIVIAFLESNSH